ncbi:MAG: hypothetical protein E7313_06495 [Clostridiales bacterium]|nr:hypothetical protein [Clostridiales bacterium]
MEKNNKKVIVYMVVASVFLLVLIVGATYAYFAAGNSATGTTNLDASTEKVGTVVVENPTENLYLKLSAYDMQQNKAGNFYYATNDESKNYETTRVNYTISKYNIDGGVDDTIYNCRFNLNITAPSQIKSGDMYLHLEGLNGAKINGVTEINSSLGTVTNYTVSFITEGNNSGELVNGTISFYNKSSDQSYLEGETLSTVITNSELDCEVAESICIYDTSSTISEGNPGAKYNCIVNPNEEPYEFYLMENNEDGTSDLIMTSNIYSDGTPTGDTRVIQETNPSKYNVTAWNTTSDTTQGPVTAMEFLYNATKNWTNVEPLNFEYYDRQTQGIDETNPVSKINGARIGYSSLISTNGVVTITKGDVEQTQVVIGTETEPLRARMPVASNDETKTEIGRKNENNGYLFPSINGTYWTLSSHNNYPGIPYRIGDYGPTSSGPATDMIFIRPVITTEL